MSEEIIDGFIFFKEAKLDLHQWLRQQNRAMGFEL